MPGLVVIGRPKAQTIKKIIKKRRAHEDFEES